MRLVPTTEKTINAAKAANTSHLCLSVQMAARLKLLFTLSIFIVFEFICCLVYGL